MSQHGGGIRQRLDKIAQKLGGNHRTISSSGYFTISESVKVDFKQIIDGSDGITPEGWSLFEDLTQPFRRPLPRPRVGRHRKVAAA